MSASVNIFNADFGFGLLIVLFQCVTFPLVSSHVVSVLRLALFTSLFVTILQENEGLGH